MTTNAADGEIHLVWEDFTAPVAAVENRTVAEIRLELIDHSGSPVEFSFTGAEIVDAAGEAYGLELSGGALIMNSGQGVLPSAYALEQNSPNPFNPYTTIRAAMKDGGEYALTIYNIVGENIRAYRGHHEAGVVELIWDGRDENGAVMPSGIYLYRFRAAAFSDTKKMMLVK
jgi:hypothetical protein